MIFNLLKLRLIQAQRILKSVGLLYCVLILCVYLIVLLKLLKTNTTDGHLLAGSLLVLSIVSLHFTRNDKRFIYTTYHEKAYLAFLFEYNLLILPFSFTFLFGPATWLLLLVHLMVSCISILEYKSINLSLSTSYVLFSLIPKQMFEWRSGMRKSQFFILILYILAVGLGFKYYGSFIILGLITFLLANFYNEAEPLNILLLNHHNSRQFLKDKLKNHTKFYLFFIAPILVIYFIKYPKYLIFYIPLILIYILNFLVFILNKYKSYIPNKLNNSNTIIIAMMFIGMFIPFMFPLSIILVFVYYKKSVKNLNYYFNAENQ